MIFFFFYFIQSFDTVTVAKYIKINFNEFGVFSCCFKLGGTNLKSRKASLCTVGTSPGCQEVCCASSPPERADEDRGQLASKADVTYIKVLVFTLLFGCLLFLHPWPQFLAQRLHCLLWNIAGVGLQVAQHVLVGVSQQKTMSKN